MKTIEEGSVQAMAVAREAIEAIKSLTSGRDEIERLSEVVHEQERAVQEGISLLRAQMEEADHQNELRWQRWKDVVAKERPPQLTRKKTPPPEPAPATRSRIPDGNYRNDFPFSRFVSFTNFPQSLQLKAEN